jgi:tartrate-resistant acid phosphatase type 5
MATRARNYTVLCATVGLCAALGCVRPTGDRERRGGLRVAVIGDFGSNDAVEAGVATLVRSWYPDLVATVGDNNYPNGSADTIDANVGKYYHDFIAPYSGRFGAGAATNRFFPTLGNHDWKAAGAAPYFDYFDLPGNERYYAVRRGQMELVLLDSDEHEPDGIARDSVQAEWLRTALAASTARYRLVLLHHPPFSSGEHHSSPTLQWPFREWGATAVLAGHDHDYERVDRAGMPYVVVGTGGKRLYDFNSIVGGSQVRVANQHGALLIELRDERASARFVTSEGTVLDSFALPSVGDLPSATSLIPAGSRWRYLAAGAVPGADWRSHGFDDSSWRVTTTIQTEPSPSAKISRIAFTKNRGIPFTSSFLRRRFEVADRAAFGWVELALPVDDEVVAHLNGAEVVHATHLRKRAGGATRFHTLVDPNALVAGTNLVAVELRHRGGPPDPARFDAELVGFSATSPLVAEGAFWQYYEGSGAPPPGWKRAGFDGSAWSRGSAPLGWGAAGIATPLRRPDVGSGPIRLRQEFVVDRAIAFHELLLRIERAQGGIAYLNRVEVARWNLTDPDVALHDTPGTGGASPTSGVVEIPLASNLLADGNNVLAVELHPRGDAESSLWFDVALHAVR